MALYINSLVVALFLVGVAGDVCGSALLVNVALFTISVRVIGAVAGIVGETAPLALAPRLRARVLLDGLLAVGGQVREGRERVLLALPVLDLRSALLKVRIRTVRRQRTYPIIRVLH